MIGRILRPPAYHAATWARAVSDPDRREAWQLLRAGDRASREELQAMRDRALVSLLRHAYAHVPYYRRVMDERGIAPDALRSVEDLELFPPLTKEIIRTEGERLRAAGFSGEHLLLRRSGGTTGEPIRSFVDPRARALETFSLLRGWKWMGWRPGLRMVNLFGGSLGRPGATGLYDRAKQWALGSAFLPAFELSRETAPRYFRKLAEAGPCVLVGYASALVSLAALAQEVRPAGLRVRMVFSTAELLPPDWAERIRSAFGCPVQSYYGCGEVNSLGYQVEDDGPYVVPDEHVVLEGSGGGVSPLRVTTLFNYAQPLIRYEMGDVGEIAPPGSLHPTRSTIRVLEGRATDLFVATDGTSVSGSFAPHIIAVTGLPVRVYQFVQHHRGLLEFRYLPEHAELEPEDLGEVAAILRSNLGSDLEVVFRRTGEFVLSPAGKHRIVVQSTDGRQLA